jgi:hypothetical protein
MRAIGMTILFCGAAGLLGGCSPFERIDFVLESTPPAAAVVTYDEIRIPEGIAVITTARPMSSDSLMSTDTRIQLSAADPQVLGVAFALPRQLDEGSEDPTWTYVLSGNRAGSTKLVVQIDGAVKKEIPAIVQAQ